LLDNLEELTVLNDAVTRSLIRGTSASDMIRGLPRSDILLGLEGNDILRGQKGNDLINGGPGNDTLRGKSGDDLLFGNVGKDNIKGGNGNDILDGGEWRDILTGGGGNDIYMLQSSSGFDRIHGLKVGKDTIQFQNDINPSDLVLLNWRDGTLIRFNNGANMKGRIAWIRNLDASQISVDDIINVSNVADPSTL
jgi:Ca2+-binding RTX toxin-like protein